MPRYAAFLRGVSPLNAKMPALKQAFESAGFSAVTTVLGSGNVVFDARRASETTLQHRAEAAMRDRLGQSFLTIVRPVEHLHRLLAADPFRRFRLPRAPSGSSPSSSPSPKQTSSCPWSIRAPGS